MGRCKAVLNLTVVFASMVGLAGCTSFNREDPLANYTLPGELPAEKGMLTQFTEGLMASARDSVGLGPNEEIAQRHFDDAMAIYQEASRLEGKARTKRYEEAAKLFGNAATRWPSSSIEEDSLFFQGESYFFADRCPKAESFFGTVISKYPSTKYIENISQRRFQIAKYWLDHHEATGSLSITPNFTAKERPTFDSFGNAIKVLERIRLDDPTGELADDATMLAATACYEVGKIYRADELLSDLRRSFPNSKHQYDAHMIGLQCKIQLYQGPSYDAGPLDDAEHLVKQMQRQFPQEAREDLPFLTKASKDVRMNRAIRDWNLAKYRDRRKEYGAARIQYERVAKEFSDTSLAQSAKTRLADLGGKPDLPPQRLEWLAKAFPTEDAEKPLLR